MNVVDVDPVRDPTWRDFVCSRPTSVFHAPAWLRVLADTYGFPLRARMLVDAAGIPTAGLAYAEIDDFLQRRIRSLPFSDFCDPLVTSTEDWRALTDDLVAQGVSIDMRCLQSTCWSRDERFTVEHESFWHGIDLTRSVQELWDGVNSAARRSIRKARSVGVVVRVAEDERDLRAFFDLHLRVRKYKYRLLAQPYAFFQNIWRQFVVPGDGLLLLAMHGRDVAGGVFFLRWQDTMYYKFNASDGVQLAVRPNDLTLWEGVTRARELGCQLLDLGISEPAQEGLVRYKRKYATVEERVRFVRHTPQDHGATNGDASRALLGELTTLLVDEKVPDHISERAGTLLYRYFT